MEFSCLKTCENNTQKQIFLINVLMQHYYTNMEVLEDFGAKKLRLCIVKKFSCLIFCDRMS